MKTRKQIKLRLVEIEDEIERALHTLKSMNGTPQDMVTVCTEARCRNDIHRCDHEKVILEWVID